MYIQLALPPGQPCLSAILPNYNQPRSLGLHGGVYDDWTHVSGDTWSYTWVDSSGTWVLTTTCGTLAAGKQDMRVKNNASGVLGSLQAASSYATGYPGVISWSLPAGDPPGFPGVSIALYLYTVPGVRQRIDVSGVNATSLSVTLPVASIVGNALLLVFFQNGGSNSGLALTDPTTPAGWTKLRTTSTHRMTVFTRLNAPATSAVTLVNSGAGDQQRLYLLEVWESYVGSVATDQVKDTTGAGTSVVVGPLTGSGGPFQWIAFVEQHISSAGATGGATFSNSSGPMTLVVSHIEGLQGTLPPYENMTTGVLTYLQNPGGTLSDTIASTANRSWDTWLVGFA